MHRLTANCLVGFDIGFMPASFANCVVLLGSRQKRALRYGGATGRGGTDQSLAWDRSLLLHS